MTAAGLPTHHTAAGIDVAEARKGLDLVILDQDRRVVTSAGRLSVTEVVGRVLHERPQIVCIDSPSQWSTSGASRACERALRKIGINAFSTGPDPGPHPFYGWMRVGFSLYAGLHPTYRRYRGGSAEGSAAEVFPEASAVLLAGRLRGPNEHKRTFRGDVLKDHLVDCASLPTVDRIDAALGALTGLIALESRHTWVGDPEEGTILLPVAALPSAALVRQGRTQSAGSEAPSAKALAVTAGAAPLGMPTCRCGCGALVRRRFLPGHDAKLKSRLLQGLREGDLDAMRALRDLGWLPGS